MYLQVSNTFYERLMREIEQISTDYKLFCATLEEITGKPPHEDNDRVFAFSPSKIAELVSRFETFHRHTCDIATKTPYDLVGVLLADDLGDHGTVLIPCSFDALIGQGLIFYLGEVHASVLMLKTVLEQQELLTNDLVASTKYLGAADVSLLWTLINITRKPIAELVHIDERNVTARIMPEN